jgi:hypothetical protein
MHARKLYEAHCKQCLLWSNESRAQSLERLVIGIAQAPSQGSRKKPGEIFRNALYHVALTSPSNLDRGLAVRRKRLIKASRSCDGITGMNRDIYAGEMRYERFLRMA